VAAASKQPDLPCATFWILFTDVCDRLRAVHLGHQKGLCQWFVLLIIRNWRFIPLFISQLSSHALVDWSMQIFFDNRVSTAVKSIEGTKKQQTIFGALSAFCFVLAFLAKQNFALLVILIFCHFRLLRLAPQSQLLHPPSQRNSYRSYVARFCVSTCSLRSLD
jgi:hypothetical protein